MVKTESANKDRKGILFISGCTKTNIVDVNIDAKIFIQLCFIIETIPLMKLHNIMNIMKIDFLFSLAILCFNNFVLNQSKYKKIQH